jgi:hypothetical protein
MMRCLRKLPSAYVSSSIHHLPRTDPLHAREISCFGMLQRSTPRRTQQHKLSWQRTVWHTHTHRRSLVFFRQTHLPWTEGANFWHDQSHNHLQRSAKISSSYLCSVTRHGIQKRHTDRHIHSFIIYCNQTWHSKETHRQTDIRSFIIYCYPFVITVVLVGLLLLLLLLSSSSSLWLVLRRFSHKKLHELNVNVIKNKAQLLWIHYLQDITY